MTRAMIDGLTIGDQLAQAIARGTPCQVTFSTGSVEVGDVRYYGKDPNDGKDLWILSTPTSQHFFGLGEVRGVQ